MPRASFSDVQGSAPPTAAAPSGGGRASFDDVQGANVPRGTFDQQPSLLQQAGHSALDFGKGLAKGVLTTTSGLGGLIHNAGEYVHPGLGEAIIPAAGLKDEQEYSQPHNTAQSLGRGTEQAGEFLVPGLGEEAAGEHAAVLTAEHAPQIARFAKPAAKLAYQGLTSGVVNKVQGGGFGTGAVIGSAGAGLGLGAKAIAPYATELAQGISGSGGKTGKAILNETSGILPNTIRKSAQVAANGIGTQLEDVMRKASTRPPAKIAGLLQAPERDIPLHSSPDVQGTPSRVANFHQPDRVAPLGLPVPTRDVPMTSHAGFPDQLPSGHTQIPTIETPPHPGMGHGEFTGQIPGERGGSGQVQGVLRTRSPQGEVIPPGQEIPYRGISLQPTRDLAQQKIAEANLQGNTKLAKGISKIDQSTLANRGLAGPRPDTVSPYEYWQTKRGVGDAVSATKWRPGYNDPFTRVQKSLYGNMADTLHKAVPESVPLDSRYSALVGATKPAQRSLWGHAAGPLAGTVIGGTEGYNSGGIGGAVKGALIGGTIGAAAPAAINTAARMVWSPLLNKMIPAATGAALQLDRKPDRLAKALQQ